MRPHAWPRREFLARATKATARVSRQLAHSRAWCGAHLVTDREDQVVEAVLVLDLEGQRATRREKEASGIERDVIRSAIAVVIVAMAVATIATAILDKYLVRLYYSGPPSCVTNPPFEPGLVTQTK